MIKTLLFAVAVFLGLPLCVFLVGAVEGGMIFALILALGAVAIAGLRSKGGR